ncbi:MAG: hypothetical protein AVDCRST_MAG38-2954 [uncultured Solirubrobacteraceae bacterium]|uniref:Uncharacterized protein n=1 Tax=uncultured Solirubrobacteraceae bacterium TaxID=1162706 RepID=A0A6J4SE56_9ACTN|nr:MAG: hypothetical protein AVDCRST_MAG38-2954 [uncultured Solirubrobacteraceae bacterium]
MRIKKKWAVGLAVSVGLAMAMPATAAATCAPEATSQPFAALGDENHYFLAPGGDFEGGLSWTAWGNPTIVDGIGNGIDSGTRAVRLPQNAAITSPAICFDVDRPHIRLMARSLTANGTLRVDAIDASGEKNPLAKLDGANHQAWAASPFVNLDPRLELAATPSQLAKLRIIALTGHWLVDAVYVDPYTRG